jgi:hypothetical protein
MQASHWLDEAANDAKASLVTLANAQKLLRRRETTLEKADRALTAYLKKGGAK